MRGDDGRRARFRRFVGVGAAVVTVALLSLAPGASAESHTADLVLTKTGPATANTGDTVAYTIVVTNNGPAEATGLALDEGPSAALEPVSLTGPAGWTCRVVGGMYSCTAPTMASGATATFTFTATIKPGYEGTTATNTAAVFTSIDDSRDDNIDTASTDILAAQATTTTTTAPTTTTVTPSTTEPSTGGTGSTAVASTTASSGADPVLPRTGSDLGLLVGIGAVVIGAGGVLLATRRRLLRRS